MLWKKRSNWFKKRVYADAAAATPLSRRSKRELVRLLGHFGNPGALHSEATSAKRELEAARETIAASIGAHQDEIVFTASGTEANNLTLQGVLRPLLREDKNIHAITSAIEHQSVLEPLRALAREGLALTEVPVDGEGFVFPNAVSSAITPATALVSIQLINSEVGTIEPVREIAKELRRAKHKIYLHTDASQAPLWLDIDVEKLGVDLLTLDAQKVLGPKGVGALYIKRGTPIEPVLWGGRQERGLRGGTENLPLAGAFAVALHDAQQGVQMRAKATGAVRDYLFSEIKKRLPDVLLHGAPLGEKRAANNLNISIPGLDAQMAVIALDAEGIAASTRSACTIGDEAPSHVIAALGVPKDLQKTAIRITLLPDVSYSEARRIAQTLYEVALRYRN